ncbi:MAG: ferrous iron transport protein B [Acutalibacteraceae bacterium]
MKIALVGNPNCGKSSLFNLLTSSDEYVGNRAGVTVGAKEKRMSANHEFLIADTPGAYSLSDFSPDEEAALDYLIREKPDVLVNLIDSRYLRRSLGLTVQLLEMKTPMIVALNFFDVRADTSITGKLCAALSVPVVKLNVKKGEGVDLLCRTLCCGDFKTPAAPEIYGAETEKAIRQIEDFFAGERFSRFYAVEMLKENETVQRLLSKEKKAQALKIVAAEKEKRGDLIAQTANAKFLFVDETLKKCGFEQNTQKSVSQKIDKVVLNRFLAFPIFFAVIFAVYYLCICIVGSAFSSVLCDKLFGQSAALNIAALLEKIGCAPLLGRFFSQAVFRCVGNVLSFVMQVFMLFFSVSMLEESGYMSRIAFLFDSAAQKTGLSGKSVISFFVASGCSVTGMMSARTIENAKQRKLTVMLVPFIPCSAKVTVIALIAGNAFRSKGLTMFFIYLFAVLSVIFSAKLLSKTKLFGSDGTFLLEMPPYILPSVFSAIKKAFRQSLSFAKKAMSVVLISSAVLWLISNFSLSGGLHEAKNFSESITASVGSVLSKFFLPLGFGNPQAACAVISGLFAKENIISALTLFSTLAEMNTAQALSFLCFNLFCPPCVVAVGTMKKELSRPKLTAFSLLFQTAFAYAASFILYRILLILML